LFLSLSGRDGRIPDSFPVLATLVIYTAANSARLDGDKLKHSPAGRGSETNDDPSSHVRPAYPSCGSSDDSCASRPTLIYHARKIATQRRPINPAIHRSTKDGRVLRTYLACPSCRPLRSASCVIAGVSVSPLCGNCHSMTLSARALTGPSESRFRKALLPST
jgi:hypothetical protein